MGVVVSAEVGAVVVLHRLGSVAGFGLPHGSVGRWLNATPAVDVAASVLRLVALALAWWLLASTLLWLAVRVAGSSTRAVRHLRALEPFAFPGVRRLVDAALAVGIAGIVSGATLVPVAASAAPAPVPAPTSPTTAPAFVLDHPDHRAAGPTPTAPVRSGRAALAEVPRAAPPSTTTPTTTAPLFDPAPTVSTTAPPTTAAPAAAPAPAPTSAPPPPPADAPAPLPRTHVVSPGENLWLIAAAQVGTATGRAPAALPATDVAPYWRALCDANRATLRSGNPSLIYAGEVITLPSV